MDDQFDPTVNFERPDPIQELCDRFKAEWESGSQPCIREYVKETPASLQERLVSELLQLEFSLRKDSGEDLSMDELVSNFPEFTNLHSTRNLSMENTRTFDSTSRRTDSDYPSTIGEYHVEGEVARGGMGIVLKASDPAIGRDLALKVGLFNRDNETGITRFLNEARITGQLQHPGIPPVHEIGTLDDGRPFFAMKLIEGTTLSSQLQKRKDLATDLTRLLFVFRKICETVAYAHARGIVHRDLKPENIMVGAFGEVQVMDWGLAKRLELEESTTKTSPLEQGDETERLVTMDGSVMGTPSYMPPEQARGDVAEVDKQSDVFGLGAILCEILTGKAPFGGTNAREVLQKAAAGDCSDAIDRLENSQVDQVLSDLTKRCLANEKVQRPLDADEVAKGITSYQNQVVERAREAELERAQSEVRFVEEKKRARLRLSLLAAISILILVAIGSYAGYQQMESARVADELREEQELTSRRERIDSAVVQSLEEAERIHKELADNLKEPLRSYQLLSDIGDWKRLVASARAFVTRAEKVANSDPGVLPAPTQERLTVIGKAISQDEADLAVALDLDRVQAERFSFQGLKRRKDEDDFIQVFKNNGIDIRSADDTQMSKLAEQIENSPLKYAWLNSIDSWLALAPPPEITRKLGILGAAINKDPLRQKLVLWTFAVDAATLESEVRKIETEKHSPTTLAYACRLMRRYGHDTTLLFERALLTYPNNYQLNNELAIAIKDPKTRAIAMRNLVIIRPDSAVSWRNLGWSLALAGQHKSAIFAIRKALEIDPEFASAWQDLGSLLLAEELDVDEAEAAVRKCIELGNNSTTVKYTLGRVFYAQKKYKQAIEAFRPDATENKSASAWTMIAQAHVELKELEQAKAAYQKVLELSVTEQKPRFNGDVELGVVGERGAIARIGLAKILVLEGKLTAALKLIDETTRLFPSDDDVWLKVAAFYIFAEKFAPAVRRRQLEALQMAVKVNPENGRAWSELGRALAESGSPDQAIPALRKALQITPSDGAVWINLGTALMATGKMDEGKATLDKALKMDPRYAPNYWSSLGNGSAQHRRWKVAASAFEALHRLNPSEKTTITRLTLVYTMLAEVEKCTKLLEESLKTHPNDAYLQQQLRLARYDRGLLRLANDKPESFSKLPPKQHLRGQFLLGKQALVRGERKAAIEIADKIYEHEKTDFEGLFDASCLFARCLEDMMLDKKRDEEAEEKLAAKAIDAIQASRSMGWMDIDYKNAKNDLDLFIMQKRAKFKKAIAR